MLARRGPHTWESCMESQDRCLEELLPPARRNRVRLPSVVRHMLGQVGCPDKNPPAQHRAPVSMAPRTDSAAPRTDSSTERVARALGRLRAAPGSALRRGTAPSTFETRAMSWNTAVDAKSGAHHWLLPVARRMRKREMKCGDSTCCPFPRRGEEEKSRCAVPAQRT